MEEVLQAQHRSLDATDAYASAWSAALKGAQNKNLRQVPWGGRGKGGRGISRRTFQPDDIMVDGVTLEYVNDANLSGSGGGGSKLLLSDACLKLLPGKVYALVGRNGVGKSTLLKRVSARKIPGFPLHINSLFLPQEVFGYEDLTPVEYLVQHYSSLKGNSKEGNKLSIAALEEQLDALDVDAGDYQEKMECICNRIADLEDSDETNEEDNIIERAHEALRYFGVPLSSFSTPTVSLSGGIRKKVALASILMEKQQLILLDEPTCHIDIDGILQLRQLIDDLVQSNSTVVLVSHDVDMMNDLSTDVIHFHNHKLEYYTGNYYDFIKYRTEVIKHQIKQAGALEKQRVSMIHTIDNLKKKASGTESRTAKKKLDRTIESKKKKLERHGIEKNELGHRRTDQKDGGIKKGSINAIDATTRNSLSHKELLKKAEVFVGPVPDKAVQFDFRPVTSTWGDEPLVMLMDVGHSYNPEEGHIFDCVELSIREGSRTIILGENGSGKSTLLSILARQTNPSEGTVHYANGLVTGYFHQHSADDLIHNASVLVTPLSYLSNKYPTKTEQDIRGELTRYGLSPKQSATNVKFLSGGERCRLCMASMMLSDPQLIVIDEITNHLDCESVEALIYGLKHWNGSLVLASHDANFIRSIGGDCVVLFDGKLQRVPGGVDSYLHLYMKFYYSMRAL
jgi:ATPase subunit of ABC transporter with duplicated ATPase domains